MHDSRVFRQSSLGQSLTPGIDMPRKIPAGTYLIGDAGYPSNVDILVPYPSVVNPANEWFNFIQSSTRICVEQAFGRLKNRFRILLHAQNANPFRARNTTFACMILHKILNQRGTLYLQVWDERCILESGYAEVPRTLLMCKCPQLRAMVSQCGPVATLCGTSCTIHSLYDTLLFNLLSAHNKLSPFAKQDAVDQINGYLIGTCTHK
jgi:hypothetical protein